MGEVSIYGTSTSESGQRGGKERRSHYLFVMIATGFITTVVIHKTGESLRSLGLPDLEGADLLGDSDLKRSFSSLRLLKESFLRINLSGFLEIRMPHCFTS
jgi:hypothetical protein